MRQPAALGGRAERADLLLAGHHRQAGGGRELVIGDRHDAAARAAAMLDARHHLLADIAALVEIDAGELVHVGFVREGVAIGEIHAAARHAERDAVRVIGRRRRSASAPSSAAASAARCGGSMRARAQARAGADRDKSRPYSLNAAPSQTAITPSASDRSSTVDLGAQLVEVELFHQRARPARAGNRGRSRRRRRARPRRR